MAGNTKAERVATMPEKCSHKTEVIRFRVATKDRAVMEAAAKEAGLTLSDWMRSRLLLAAAGKPAKPEMASMKPPRLLQSGMTGGDSGKWSHGRPDPDKIAAFQKAAGMGGVKK